MSPLDVHTTLVYCKETGRRPYLYSYLRSDEQRTKTPHQAADVDNEAKQVDVFIRDGRPLKLTMQKNGFQLFKHVTSMKTDEFYLDRDKIMNVYYKEIAEMVKKETGAAYVYMFHHDLRCNAKTSADHWNSHAIQSVKTYLPYVHTDSHHNHAETEFAKYAQNNDECRKYSKGRFMFFTAWRSIDFEDPVQDYTLTVCDESSLVKPDDYITVDLHLTEAQIKQVYHIKTGNEKKHKWYYFPKMTADEVLLFKNWDSDRDLTSRTIFHSSFKDPNAPPNAKPRQSIEARGYAYFPDHEPDTCSMLVKDTNDVPVEEGVVKVTSAVKAFKSWLPTSQAWAKGLMETQSIDEFFTEVVLDRMGTLGLADCTPANKRKIVEACLASTDLVSLLKEETANITLLKTGKTGGADDGGNGLSKETLIAASVGVAAGAALTYAVIGGRK